MQLDLKRQKSSNTKVIAPGSYKPGNKHGKEDLSSSPSPAGSQNKCSLRECRESSRSYRQPSKYFRRQNSPQGSASGDTSKSPPTESSEAAGDRETKDRETSPSSCLEQSRGEEEE
eukprot:jgi/Mesen1/9546/ME000064S08896